MSTKQQHITKIRR